MLCIGWCQVEKAPRFAYKLALQQMGLPLGGGGGMAKFESTSFYPVLFIFFEDLMDLLSLHTFHRDIASRCFLLICFPAKAEAPHVADFLWLAWNFEPDCRRSAAFFNIHLSNFWKTYVLCRYSRSENVSYFLFTTPLPYLACAKVFSCPYHSN